MKHLFLQQLNSGTSQLAVKVTVEAVSSTMVSVQWDYLRACNQISGLPVIFTVQHTLMSSIKDYNGIIKQTRVMNTTNTQAQLSGLMPYTNYSIKVAVVNEMGDV